MHIVVVGGVHGSGKSTLCKQLSAIIDADIMRASAILGFSSDPNDPTGKAVSDIQQNQDRVIYAFRQRRSDRRPVLLDGHFALLHRSGAILPVPTATFRGLHARALVLVEADSHQVRRRLELRGEWGLDVGLIDRLATAERTQALRVSQDLRIPLLAWTSDLGPGTAALFLRTAGIGRRPQAP